MILRYSKKQGCFYLLPAEMSYEDSKTAFRNGFNWSDLAKAWLTWSPYCALVFYRHADEEAKQLLAPLVARYIRSADTGEGDADRVTVPVPEDLEYLPFQLAGIDAILKSLKGE